MSESHTHLDIKADLYWSQIEIGIFARDEKNIGKTRTDVLTYVRDYLVAVEIQHTPLSMKSVQHRMLQHTREGAHTLWLFTPELLIYNGNQIRNFNWVLFIQSIQDGMIFMPCENPQKIMPARIGNADGQKILDKKDPIDLDELDFETMQGLNTTCKKGLEWDTKEMDGY